MGWRDDGVSGGSLEWGDIGRLELTPEGQKVLDTYQKKKEN